MAFFAGKVKYPSRVKLFKLLFYLDFRHIHERGISVTNLDYSAYPYGPVADSLFKEVASGSKDIARFLREKIVSAPTEQERYEYSPQIKPDTSIFTPRELRIMNELIEIWRDARPSIMSEATHFRGTPWDRTKREKGEWAQIDPALALGDDSSFTAEDVHRMQTERREMLANHSTK